MPTVQKKQIPKKRQKKKQKNKKNSDLVNWSRAGKLLAQFGPIDIKH
jgi:hypothetical protein